MKASARLVQAIAIGAAVAGCSSSKGELVLAVQTDMVSPKDIDAFELQISSGGSPIYPNTRFLLGSEDVSLPATLGLEVSEDPAREISIRLRGTLADRTRVERVVVTTVPEDRVATLWLPLSFLCSAEVGADEPPSCPAGQTCSAGECREASVPSSQLPDYDHGLVFGAGGCFDVDACFFGAAPAEIDDVTCTIAESGDVNVALASEGEGYCGVSGCFVPLDAESDVGWRRAASGRIELPKAACASSSAGRLAGPRVVTAPVTAACPSKKIGTPMCKASAEAPRPIALAAWQRRPGALVVSESEVFWTEEGGSAGTDAPARGAVKRIGLGGGLPRPIAQSAAVPRDIALDAAGSLLYWTERGSGGEGALMQSDLSSGASPKAVFSRTLPEGVAVSDGVVYWTELRQGGGIGGGLFRAADEMAPEAIADADVGIRVAAAGDVICWTDEGRRGAGAVRCLVGETTTPVGVGSAEAGPHGIALDVAGGAQHVYWVNFGGAEGRGQVVRGAVDGTRREVLFEGSAGPYGIALDEERVYWTNRIEGVVLALPRAAGPDAQPEEIAKGQHNPGAIAVDDGAIYWVNEGSSDRADGSVVRLPKR